MPPLLRPFLLMLAVCASLAPLVHGQCTLTLQNSASAPIAGSGGTFEITVVASTGVCPRTAVSNNTDWLTISYGQSSSEKSSIIGYTVAPNLSTSPRTGSITVSPSVAVGGQAVTLTVTQAGANCTYSFSQSIFSVPARNVASFVVIVNTGCTWTVSAGASWITLSTSGPFTGRGSFVVTVADNLTTKFRLGTIQIGSQSIQIQQVGVTCASTVGPLSASIPATGGSATFNVTIDAACTWTVSNLIPWINVSSSSLTNGPGTFTATVAPNVLPQTRTASLTIAGQTVQISQAGAGIQFSATAIQNAGSLSGGALSPGEIFVIYGSGLGPQVLKGAQTTSDGLSITSSLAFTRVLFDGVPAPMVYSSSTQVSAIVPYTVQPGIANVTVEYLGIPSAPVQVTIAPMSPGVFTSSQNGSGQASALNQDYSVNAPGSGETAGRVLTIYWTGGGLLNPMPVDGALVSVDPPYPVLTTSMTATVGNASAAILYSGAVPTLAPGILQTSIVVPADAPRGDAVPLQFQFGGGLYNTQPNVTVAIQ